MEEQEVKKMSYFEYIVAELSNNSTISLEVLYSIKEKLNKIKPMDEPKSSSTNESKLELNCVAAHFTDELNKQERIRTILVEINNYLNELV